MIKKTVLPFAFKVASRMLTEKTFSSGWLCLSRGFASQIHGTTLTVFHYMSVSLMCRHVASQIKLTVESPLTNMTSLVSDVQVDRVLVVWLITPRLCTKFASNVIACKRSLVAVHVSLVLRDTSPPRGPKSASRMIAGKRSGSPVKPFQMMRYTGLRCWRILTTRLRTFEDVAVNFPLITSHVTSPLGANIRDIASKRSFTPDPGVVVHADCWGGEEKKLLKWANRITRIRNNRNAAEKGRVIGMTSSPQLSLLCQ